MALEDHVALPVSPRMGEALRFWKRWGERRPVRQPEAYATESGRGALEEFNRGVLLAAVGDEEAALLAYRRVIRQAGGDLAAKAAFNIAVLHSCDGSAAAAAYGVAIDTGHVDVAPKAAYNLGCLRQQAGDHVGATEAFQQAVQFDHEPVSAHAALKLQELSAAAATARALSIPEFAPRLIRYQSRSDRRQRGHRLNWLPTGNRFSGARRSRGAAN